MQTPPPITLRLLHGEALPEALRLVGENGYHLTGRRWSSETAMEQLLTHASCAESIYSIQADSESIGILWLEESGGVLVVELILLRREWTGRGIGRLILSRAYDIARRRGSSALGLTVHPTNTRMLHLIEAMGFRPAGLPDYFELPCPDPGQPPPSLSTGGRGG